MRLIKRQITCVLLQILLSLGPITIFAQETFNFETVSHNLISANVSDIEVRDGLAYCAGDYGLSVWSLEDPDTLEFVSRCQTPGDAVAVALRGDYAYLADASRGVAIINISNPEAPQYIDEFEYDMNYWRAPVDIDVHDSLLLVSNIYDGMVIASLSDPERPEILLQGEFENGEYTHLQMKENFLFINDEGTSAVLVVDVSDFDNPEIVAEIRNRGNCVDIDIQNDLFAVMGWDTLFFYSIENPAEPEKLGYIPSRMGLNREIGFYSNYLVTSGDGIRVYDVSDPRRPTLTDFIRNGSQDKFAISNDLAYCALDWRGISVVSIENPRDLQAVGSLHEEFHHIFLCKSGDLVFLLNDLYGLIILNVSNPESPEIVSELDLSVPDIGSSGDGVLLHDNILYFKLYDLLNLIDVSDIENPHVISRLEIVGSSLGFSLVDNYLIVTGELIRDAIGVIDGNMIVVDVSDAENPHRVFAANDGAYAPYPGVISNGILYQLADIEGQGGYVKEVLVYSLDNPAHPRLMGRWPQADYSLFLTAGGLLYSHYDNGDFVGYSVDDPLEPEMVGVLRLNGANNLASTCWTVDGDLVYLGSYWDNLVAISVVDPQNPRLVGYCNTPGSVCDMLGEDGLLYVADRNNFGIYRFTGDIGEGGNENIYRIAIEPGWNFISAPIRPNIRNIVSIFNPVAGSLVMAKDYRGNFYIPARGFNNIPLWDYHQGYQVKLTRRASLPIEGDPVAVDTPININQGWYFAPYYPAQPQEPEVAFANIRDQLRLAKDDKGDFYVPAQNFSNMRLLRQGNAYQVLVSENVEFVWNVDQERIANSEILKPELHHYSLPTPTGSGMSLLLNGLPPQSEVGVYTYSGLLVGAGYSSEKGQCGIAVWGDDPTTPEIDGAIEGEALTFSFWDGVAEFDADVEFTEGSGMYTTDRFAQLYIVELVSQPTEWSLSEPYPNPFNLLTTIKFALLEDSKVRLTIYDLSGREVTSLVNVELKAGTHSATWNAEGFTSGIYLVKMETPNFDEVRRVILLK